MSEIKKDVIKELVPFFGQQVEKILIDYYDRPVELFDVAKEMLSRYLGEDAASKKLQEIRKRYLKVLVDEA